LAGNLSKCIFERLVNDSSLNPPSVSQSRKTLLLVDGSSYLYRAFHALPDLRNAAGEPTNAIKGVLSMLHKLRREHAADYIACVFDAKGKTFRDDLYPDYKATRAPMPDDLRSQIEPLHEAIRAEGWPLVVIDGVEADDVIGTLVAHATRKGIRSIVSTGDKDMAQLVDDHVTLVNTMSEETLDPAGVTAKFGVPPERIIDYLTLVGDAVDNVPGVAKCGPKTAVKWLTEYGTLDNLLAHADEIKGVVGDNLRAARDWLPQARVLITIKCDVALPFDFDDLVLKPRDAAALRALFERYEFRSWLRELDAAATGEPPRRNRIAAAITAPAMKRFSPSPRSTPGSPASTRRRRLRSTPKPPGSTRCWPSWSGCRLPSPTARRPTCRWRITMPAHPRSSIAPLCWRS
jgi:DNA polymerase I